MDGCFYDQLYHSRCCSIDLLVAFELWKTNPLVPMKLLASRNLGLLTLVAFFVGFALFGCFKLFHICLPVPFSLSSAPSLLSKINRAFKVHRHEKRFLLKKLLINLFKVGQILFSAELQCWLYLR